MQLRIAIGVPKTVTSCYIGGYGFELGSVTRFPLKIFIQYCSDIMAIYNIVVVFRGEGEIGEKDSENILHFQ